MTIAVVGQASANVINDYWDSINGSDAINHDRITPYTGGSRFIQDGALTEAQVKWLGLTTVGITLLAGIALLASLNAWQLVWIGLAGLAIGWAYSAAPFKLMSRGLWGELAIIAAWALIVVGSAMLEGHRIFLTAVILGLAYGLLVANILFANQIPDITADRQVGKFTLAVVTPTHLLWLWYGGFALAAYATVLALVAGGQITATSLLSFVGLPFSVSATLELKNAPLPRPAMTRSIKNTILAAHLFGLGLATGILLV